MKHSIKRLPFEWLDEIINLAAECIVVVDHEGNILYINPAYCDFLKKTEEEAIGKPVQDVIENSRMHIVAKTGRTEAAAIHPINGSEMIANRYPLYVNQQLVGAVGTVMFRNPQEWMDYSRKIKPLLNELNYYKNRYEKELFSKYHFGDLIGNSSLFMEAKRLAERVSDSQSAVLLLGESGTGKELFAHAIHQNSRRRYAPFLRVNCASIPEQLFESEMFGYEDGAFTGAKKGGKKGKFELAHQGTIFLDEVGDMPLHMQSKILRVLQEKEIERIGARSPVPIDVRVIAATHRNLEEMVREGDFRQDLYYRLNVIKIQIPSLRERIEDVVPIAGLLLKKLERKFGFDGLELSKEAIAVLQSYSWPGNIRELENVLERAVNVLDGKRIEPKHLNLTPEDQPIQRTIKIREYQSIQPLKETIAEAEKNAIIEALAAADGNKIKAAKLLGIGKTSLYEKCKAYQIEQA
ncbi:sigma-54 interaction domain-containing protein [Bacillus halotolerans]|uniref:sigma-54 interaction domain-containing protein n=1 Tax=Bacillus halotolerans TaxID=260554 RepID=UPI000C7BD74D|nr:sigma 54-interacting transcriptional regulator [Bacillus halotolerans]PLR91081.1 sigma-54-dependent Fis family transcriptional regulator [Bacillus halotolerans]